MREWLEAILLSLSPARLLHRYAWPSIYILQGSQCLSESKEVLSEVQGQPLYTYEALQNTGHTWSEVQGEPLGASEASQKMYKGSYPSWQRYILFIFTRFRLF